MSESTDKPKPRNLIKTSIIILAAFAGGIGGVYLGSIAFRGNVESVPFEQTLEPTFYDTDGDLINLKIGDLFPLEDVTVENGIIQNIETVLDGKPTIVLFVSLGCEPCSDLLDMWQKNIRGKLRPSVQVLVVVKEGQATIPEEYKGLLSGMKRIEIDIDRWGTIYSIDEWPTVISIDGSGFVSRIQVGFLGYFRPGLFEEVLKSPS